MTNAIIAENLNSGSTGWKGNNFATTEIQAYVSTCAVNPGSSLNLYVSTQVAGTTYTIDVYRLGYYGGLGGRLMLEAAGNVGVAQGYWNQSNGTLNNCPTAFVDSTTHLVEARWASSYTLNVPTNWCTGQYVVLLTDANGKQCYAHFCVRGTGSEDYAVVRGDATDCAYNGWGGHSLYAGGSVGGVYASKVSFDRPDNNGQGCGNLIQYDCTTIQYLESQGFDLCYLSSIDLENNLIATHKAYLSLGHDEYWSFNMRGNVEAFRDNGHGCAFLGANDCYWQIRYESGGQNGANRTVVGYKTGSSYPSDGSNGVYSTDPMYGVNNALVSSRWRDTVLNRPEASMIGIQYSSSVSGTNNNVAWTVDSGAGSSKYLAGTGLVAGSSYGADCVGYEMDNQQTGSPSNLQIIGTTPFINSSSQADHSNTTVYVAPSGAVVFASGSINWGWALAAFRRVGNGTVSIPMQFFLNNIMGALKGPVYGNLGH